MKRMKSVFTFPCFVVMHEPRIKEERRRMTK